MDTLSTDTIVKPRYALSYGLRLDKGRASEFTHARVPDSPARWIGRQHDVARDERHRGLKSRHSYSPYSIDAFFDIYADVYADVSSSTICD